MTFSAGTRSLVPPDADSGTDGFVAGQTKQRGGFVDRAVRCKNDDDGVPLEESIYDGEPSAIEVLQRAEVENERARSSDGVERLCELRCVGHVDLASDRCSDRDSAFRVYGAYVELERGANHVRVP